MENEVKFYRYKFLKLYKADNNKNLASLTWGVRMGYPRVTVFTSNDESISIYDRMITAPFDSETFMMFVNMLKSVTTLKRGEKLKMDCLNYKYRDGAKTNEIYTQATVIIGKDEDGVNYIAVIEEKKKKVKFEFLPGKFHRFYNSDGTENTDKSLLSDSFTLAYADILDKAISAVVVRENRILVPTKTPPKMNVSDGLDLD